MFGWVLLMLVLFVIAMALLNAYFGSGADAVRESEKFLKEQEQVRRRLNR